MRSSLQSETNRFFPSKYLNLDCQAEHNPYCYCVLTEAKAVSILCPPEETVRSSVKAHQ